MVPTIRVLCDSCIVIAGCISMIIWECLDAMSAEKEAEHYKEQG